MVKVLHGLQKLVWAIQGDPVSKWKPRGKSGKVQSKKRKRAESEGELESEGSGEEGWRARGFHDIAFTLLGIQERQDEQNALLREKCGFQERITSCLERMEARMGGSELDSTIRE